MVFMMAQALMSTLPGLDANDPPKTLATLKLYTCVLSSVHRLCDPAEVEQPSALDLCFGEWVEQLLERLFTLFSNLDSQPTHAAADGHAGAQDHDVRLPTRTQPGRIHGSTTNARFTGVARRGKRHQ